MRAVAKVLMASGVYPWRAWREVFKAGLSFHSARRRTRLETLLMQRKEVCEVKDSIIEFIQYYREKGNALTVAVGSRQLMDELYRREHTSRALGIALKEMLRAGQLRKATKDLPEPVYGLGDRRYFSKTSMLSGQLLAMGVYDRAVQGQRPYHQPPQFKV
jgi:hypothetical protein